MLKDPAFKKQFAEIKRNNKVRLAQYIKKDNDIVVNPDSIFDVQCKRLHEYKRQIMINVLHILAEYNRIIEDNVYAKITIQRHIYSVQRLLRVIKEQSLLSSLLTQSE